MGQAGEVSFDCRGLSLSLLLDGLALCIGKTGESFSEMLPVEDRDGEGPNAAMATALTAG